MTSMYYVMRMYVRHKQNIIFIINSTAIYVLRTCKIFKVRITNKIYG